MEIKYRIIVITISNIFTFIISYYNKEIILFLCLKPSISRFDSTFYFMATNVMDIFNIYLKLSLGISFFVTMFIILYNFLQFLAPGLYKYELIYLSKLCQQVLYTILLSNTFFYCYVFPIFWNFFYSYLPKISKLKITIQFEPKLTEFFNFFVDIFLLVNLASLLIILLINYVQIKHNQVIKLKKYKKYYILNFFIIATVLTPPDIINQIILALILISCLEIVSILILLQNNLLTWKKIKTYQNRSC